MLKVQLRLGFEELAVVEPWKQRYRRIRSVR